MNLVPKLPEDGSMPYSVRGYEQRADECVKLANQAIDQLVRMELLNLRQTYLNIAQRLRKQGFELTVPETAPEIGRDDK